MSFNGSGQFQLNSGGLPYVTGTTISSTHANNLNSDLASGLSNVICKDGQTTVTANLPMSTFRHTNVGVASARTDYARASQVQDSTLQLIGSVSGTNTILGSLSPAITAYAAGQKFSFVPANTNSGATTISINSVGAVNIFAGGTALVGGELVVGIPTVISHDGTQFNIVNSAPFGDARPLVMGTTDNTKRLRFEVDGFTTATTRVLTPMNADYTVGDRITLETPQATTSGTAFNFGSIPAGTRRIYISFAGVSLSGTDSILVQIGDAGGIENTTYVSSSGAVANAGASTVGSSTAGFIVQVGTASHIFSGVMTLTLIDAATFQWASSHSGKLATTLSVSGGGDKSLSAELTQVTITRTGTDTFDAGAVNIQYQR